MRVNTDGVLLGAWCPVDGARRVLDVGTGCGVIALQVAQRNAEATVMGIDIDEGAVTDAKQNFAASPWANRLEAKLADFNEWDDNGEPFDLIVTNPPYFANGILPAEHSRSMARHGVTLSYAQLIAGAKRLLCPNGQLAMVTPTDAQHEVVEQCAWAGMSIAQLTEVCTLSGAPPKRLLWMISKAQCVLQRSQLAIENANHTPTAEYLALCRDFYLRM